MWSPTNGGLRLHKGSVSPGVWSVLETHQDSTSCFFITCLFVLQDDPNSHWRPRANVPKTVCLCAFVTNCTDTLFSCTRSDNSLFNIDVPQSQGFWYVARSIHVDGYLRCCRQNRQKLFASTNILNILKLIMNQLKTKQQQHTTTTSTVSMYVTNTY